jgi:hypothetical protein
MVLLLPDKLPINDFISLITHEPIQRLDDSMKIKSFRHWVHPVLALGAPVVIIGTFKNKAQALRNEAYIASFTPAQEVECNLPEPVVMTHTIHGVSPSIESAVERLDTLCTLHGLGILRLSNCVVKVKLSGEIPFTVIGMLTANVIGMEGE